MVMMEGHVRKYLIFGNNGDMTMVLALCLSFQRSSDQHVALEKMGKMAMLS